MVVNMICSLDTKDCLDDKEMVEEVEQLAISNDLVEELKHKLNDRRDDPEDNIKDNQLDFIQQEDDQQNDEQSINFRSTTEVKKDEEEFFLNETIKEIQKKLDEEVFYKIISEGKYNYYKSNLKKIKLFKKIPF